jgi:hypothetical protein
VAASPTAQVDFKQLLLRAGRSPGLKRRHDGRFLATSADDEPNHRASHADPRFAGVLGEPRTPLGRALERARPLQEFLADDRVVEILLNADGRLWVEKIGEGMRCTPVRRGSFPNALTPS